MAEPSEPLNRSTTPWMLRARSIESCALVREFRRQMADRFFGEFAWLETAPDEVSQRITSVVGRLGDHAELLASWKRHLARETLVALRLGRPWAESLAEELADWPVFRDCASTLGELRSLRVAVAAFPYAEDDRGHLCQLWVFEGAAAPSEPRVDHRGRLQLASPWIEELECRLVFLVEPDPTPHAPGISGGSWQLALALALRSLAEQESTESFAALARRWIASGAVDERRQISRVEKIPAKLKARTNREWLLPAANRGEVPGYDPDGAPVTVWFARDVDSAWAHVSGEGAIDGGETAWPEKVEVMHSFVSGAWMPVVACALLCRPRRVVLWYSDNKAVSEDPSKEIKRLLESSLFKDADGFQVERRPISSRSLAEAERELAAALRKDLAGGSEVVFNVTQGNRVMSYAPMELSRLHPNLLLVYRDLDADFADFTVIRYEGNHPTTLLVKAPDPMPREDIDWTPLFTKPREPQPTTAEAMWATMEK